MDIGFKVRKKTWYKTLFAGTQFLYKQQFYCEHRAEDQFLSCQVIRLGHLLPKGSLTYLNYFEDITLPQSFVFETHVLFYSQSKQTEFL